MWWRKIPHLLAGIIFISISSYFLRVTAAGWESSRQSLKMNRGKETPEAQAGDDEIPGSDSTKTVGVLPYLLKNQKEQHEETEVASATDPLLPVDRISRSEALAPQRILHRRISVNEFQGFGFVVPAHATRPRIRGKFNSFLPDGDTGELQEENVEVLLLSEVEYRDFVHGQAGAASFGEPPSAGGVIDWTLNATLFQPVKYYLVFRNSSPQRRAELVDADFSVSFD